MTDAQPTSNADSGNYKGILLSNRPQKAFQVTNNFTPTKIAGSTTIPFMPSGKVKDLAIGLPPNREQLQSNLAARTSLKDKQKSLPKESVTFHHKQYIKQLQEQKQQEKLENIEKELRSQELKARLNDSRSKLKEVMKDANYSEKEIKGFLKSGSVESKVVKNENENNLDSKIKSNSKKKKPAWLKPIEKPKPTEPDDEELDDLLDFANNLDFEDFIEDFEVREALAVIHARVKEMEEEVKVEEKEELELRKQLRIEEARQRGLESKANLPSSSHSNTTVQHENDWNSSVRIDDDAASQKSSASIQKDKTFNRIHSNASIANATRHAVSARGERPEEVLTADEASREVERLMETIHKENARSTVVVTHSTLSTKGAPQNIEEIAAHVLPTSENERILVKMKKNPNYVQNLPYMYRCPSI